MNLNILQVLPALKGGGVERATLDLAYFLKGSHVASSGGGLVEPLISYGVNHHTLPLQTKNPYKMYKNAQALARLIVKENIDLIHVRSRAPAYSVWLACQWTKKPWVSTYHGVYNASNSLKRFYNRIMTRGDKVIAISHFVKDHVLNEHPCAKNKIAMVYEGIDTDYFDPSCVSQEESQALRNKWGLQQEQKVILLPGRFTRWKGHEVFIKALGLLNKEDIIGVLVGSFYGKETYLEHLKQQAKGLKILFIPSQKDMRPLYAASDVVLNVSIEPEAFGRVTAEALAMSRPFIGTNLGATPELCIPNKTGFLIRPNDPQALANQISYTLKNEKSLAAITSQARQHIKDHFSLSVMAQKTIAIYKALLKA